ncbi:hypothetical protein BsWGS_11015 [Bradybaena similaris]
MLASCFSRPA